MQIFAQWKERYENNRTEEGKLDLGLNNISRDLKINRILDGKAQAGSVKSEAFRTGRI